MTEPEATGPQPAEMEIEPENRSFWRNLSLVWLVPLAALAVTLFVAWQTWSDRGQLIEIRFENASGVVPDETGLRYRDVVVGFVEDVAFTDDLTAIDVSVRVDRDIAEALPEDAQFWVVRPEVSTSGVTGLTTVLSGVYLQVAFDPAPGAAASSFVGLDTAPLVQPGAKGRRITLRAANADGLTAGAPIFYKGIEVGKIEAPRLMPSRDGVMVDAFVRAPYDSLLTSATRFWHTSGVSLSVSTSGLDLSIGSLSNLVRGGLSFDTVFAGGSAVSESAVFDLFSNESSARDSVFTDVIDNAVSLAVEFDESVTGLAPGAQVVYRGVRIGTVSSLGAFVEKRDGETEVRLRATLEIDPERLGLGADAPEDEVLDFFDGAVRTGLRARLAWQSIFSQALTVDLAVLPEAAPAELIRVANAPPIIPSVKSDLPSIGATAQGLLERVDNLPIEELLEQIISSLAAIESLAGDEELRAAPEAFVGLVNDARDLVGSEGAQALPGEINTAVAELTGLLADLKQAGAVDRLMSSLAAAEDAAASFAGLATDIEGAMGELTGLMEDLRRLTDKANELELEEFLAAAGAFLDGAQKLIDTPGARALPESLVSALNEAQAALAELREGGLVASATDAIASAKSAAASIEEAAENLPALADRITALVRQAEGVVAGYGPASTTNRELVSSLREVQAAAEALNKLARAIERNPNSLLFGR